MDPITSLPRELISAIWDHISNPEDVESFAIMNHTIRGQATLEQHRNFTDEHAVFSTIITGDSLVTDDRLYSAVSMLLTKVLTDPRVGLYVQKLRLYAWSPAVGPGGWMPIFTQGERNLFWAESTKLIRPEKLNAWMSRLLTGAEDPIMGLLLINCPNIQELNIILYPGQSLPNLQALIENITASTKASTSVLQSLRRVSLCFGNSPFDIYNMGRDLDAIGFVAHIASLASVSSINACGVFASRGYDRIPCSLEPKASNVRSLTFQDSAVPINELRELLSGVKSLRSFEYASLDSREEAPTRGIPHFDPAGVCTVLLTFAKSSLEVLHLRDRCQMPRQDKISAITSLRGFTALKVMGASMSLYLQPNELGHYSVTCSMAAKMPASIECFHLWAMDFHGNMFMALRDVIISLLREKAERLPKLSSIELHAAGPWKDSEVEFFNDLVKICLKAGITLGYTRWLRDSGR